MSQSLARVVSSVVVCASLAAAQKDDPAGLPTELGQHYGFSGLHVSRFNDGIGRLVAGDLDGDGQADLALVNNARSRIELLLRRREGEAASENDTPDPERVNEMTDETFFRRESLAVEEKVGSMDLADMDGDGRSEVLFTGDSDRLTVAWHGARGGSSRAVRLRLPGSADGAMVRAGDVNGDGRIDALVCAARECWIFLQREGGEFAEAIELPLATPSPDGLELRDIDGDKRLDLLFIKADSEWPLRWRLGLSDGRFGEERSARFAAIRAWDVADMDGDGRCEVAVVRRQSGRVSVLRWREPDAAAEGTLALGAPDVLPFEALKDSERRDVLMADVDGDGEDDIVAAEASAARVLVWRGARGAPRTWPSLLGAREPRVLRRADGGRALVVAAPDEGAIGVSAIGADGALAFPRALPLPAVGEGADGASPELLALDVAPPAADQPDAIWAVLAAGKGRTRSGALVRLDADGKVLDTFKLDTLKTDPRALLVADLDRDGRSDALLCVPTELPRILLAQEAGGFKDVNVAQSPGLGLLKGLDRDALWWGDVDGDGKHELLVPGPNFARAFVLDGAGVPVVIGQYNLPDPGAQVACAAAADLDGDGKPEIVMADRSQRALEVPGADGSALRAQVELGELQPRSLRVTGGSPARLVLLAADRFGVLQAGGGGATFLPDLDFEVPVKDAFVNDLAIGDVNGDGVTDLVMTETHKHQLVIARAQKDSIDFALRFTVYEQRLFESGRSGQEPRRVVLAELTGDGLTDVVVLVHDRLIVYPQEAAP